MGNTILLADKSITIQKIVELTFSDENYQIKCVNDGQSALDAISALKPSIILADINLPVKSGYELCTILRNDPSYSAVSNVPVILLAGIYETMDEERAKQVEQKVKDVGANDLLSKPFDPQLLTAKVKELMGASVPFTTAEIPAPDPFLSDPPTSPGIFSEMPATPVPSIEAPPDMFGASSTPPPDDSERTMMLQNPFSFAGNNIFAEAPPVAQDEPVVPFEQQNTVRVEAVTPASEPLFEMSEMESAPQSEFEEPEEPAMAEAPEPSGGFFEEREDVDFSLDTQPGVVIAPPSDFPESAPFVAEAPFPSPFEVEEEAAPTAQVLGAGEDPFGDVFAEAPAPQQWSTAASEEDSPFGLPEPPPPPPAPEPVEPEPPPVLSFAPSEEETVEPERSTLAMDSIPIAESWAVAPSANMIEESIPESAAAEDDSEKVLDEIMAAPALKPDFGEDTWSQARKVAAAPVEDLFESEPAQSEEAEELQPDLSESLMPETISESPSQQEVHTPVVAGGAVEITDELIDRIAARVVAKLSERVVSEIVWQVVPDLAEKMIRRELEKLNGGE